MTILHTKYLFNLQTAFPVCSLCICLKSDLIRSGPSSQAHLFLLIPYGWGIVPLHPKGMHPSKEIHYLK